MSKHRNNITNRLKECLTNLLNESDNNQITAYHGSGDIINKFKFVSKDKANNQEGPGMYFTINYDDAKKYAGDNGYVYTVEFTPNRLLTDKPINTVDKKELRSNVLKLIKMSPNWKRVAMNYGDDLEEGLDGMLYKYIDLSRTERLVYISIYEDLYINEPELFVKGMVKLGYDGAHLSSKDGSRDNYAVYNKSKLKITNKEQII
jgi:hypothetical protein